ncbi:MAG: thioredoxin, partial [Gammaproteobacteria bacterium]
AKVNVDEAPDLAAKFGIRSIPTLVILKDGENKQQFVGLKQEAELVSALEAEQ